MCFHCFHAPVRWVSVVLQVCLNYLTNGSEGSVRVKRKSTQISGLFNPRKCPSTFLSTGTRCCCRLLALFGLLIPTELPEERESGSALSHSALSGTGLLDQCRSGLSRFESQVLDLCFEQWVHFQFKLLFNEFKKKKKKSESIIWKTSSPWHLFSCKFFCLCDEWFKIKWTVEVHTLSD